MREETLMELSIDPRKCQGHGRCVLINAELFDADESGYGLVLKPNPAPDYTADIEQAIAGCPEQAISYS